MQVAERTGPSFASGLRSTVRADPDIIMVGEMRDRDSAKIAIEAALTGHLVLSTLHTNDAPAAAARLVDMGVEPYLVASAIDCVVASGSRGDGAGTAAVPRVSRPPTSASRRRATSTPSSPSAVRAAARPATAAGSGSSRSWRSARRSARSS
jgi:hypothetical protein